MKNKYIVFIVALYGFFIVGSWALTDSTQPLHVNVERGFLNATDKAIALNEVVQNKVQETVTSFVVRTDENTKPATSPQVVETPVEKKQEVVFPSVPVEVRAALTVSGVIAQTNYYRTQAGVRALVPNTQLTLSAQKKVRDMFAQQYFEHESPDGIESDDLADSVGYAYLMVGENLALGGYESDFELVEGWMNSPGHRENILNEKYVEIGVAVEQGLFEGEWIWLAVQEFGRPLADCPEVSVALNTKIEERQILLAELQKKLSDMVDDIEDTRPKSGSVYENKVAVYNELVHQYNVFVEDSKEDVAVYNAQVKAHNACVEE